MVADVLITLQNTVRFFFASKPLPGSGHTPWGKPCPWETNRGSTPWDNHGGNPVHGRQDRHTPSRRRDRSNGPTDEQHRLARDTHIPSEHLFYTTTYTRHPRSSKTPERQRTVNTRARPEAVYIPLQMHAVFCQLRKNKVTLCLYGEETVRDGERR